MTTQLSHSIEYRGQGYSIAGKQGDGLFDPTQHGMKPIGRCTACYDGYLCTYVVDGQRLLLDQLDICLDAQGPILFGVRPKAYTRKTLMFFTRRTSIFDVVYERLQHPVPYSGGLLLARGFIEDSSLNIGYTPAWKYREVHELMFDNGELERETDRSAQMPELRREIADSYPGREAKQSEIGDWVQKWFGQEYRWW